MLTSQRRKNDCYSLERYYSTYILVTGLQPLPEWFVEKPLSLRALWKTCFIFADIGVGLCFLSSLMFVIKLGHSDKGAATECAGAVLLLSTVVIKSIILSKRLKEFQEAADRLCEMGKQLDNSPISSHGYLASRRKHMDWQTGYCRMRFIIAALAPFSLAIIYLMMGLIHDDPTHRYTPMPGWFPFNLSNRVLFALASSNQLVSFTLMSMRDSAVDIALMSILKVIHHDLVYLRELLGDLIANTNDEEQRSKINWWVSQHQQLIRILGNFSVAARPWLCLCYAYTSAMFFAIMWRFTEGDDVDMNRQAAVLALAFPGIIHLIIISDIGDKIFNDSYRIWHVMMTPRYWDHHKSLHKTMHLVLIRSNKPLSVSFADNRVLCIKSFMDIMTKMAGYFVTIFQLRHA